jgi:hypothetical protein
MNTEKQAMNLWCPMTRAASGNQLTNCSVNRVGDPQDNNCIASKCAMWRWGETTPRRFINAMNTGAATVEESGGTSIGTAPPAGWVFVPCEDDKAGWIEPEKNWLLRRTGYCGLAGNPLVAA